MLLPPFVPSYIPNVHNVSILPSHQSRVFLTKFLCIGASFNVFLYTHGACKLSPHGIGMLDDVAEEEVDACLPAFCVHGGKYRPPASLPPMPNFTCKQSQPNMLRYYLSLISLLLFGRRMGLDRVTRKPRQIKLPATPGWWAEGGRTFKAPFFMDPPSVVHVMKLLFYSLFMFLPFNVSDGRTTSRNKGSTHTGGNLHDRQWVGWITLV